MAIKKSVALVETHYALGLMSEAITEISQLRKKPDTGKLAKWRHKTVAELSEVFGPQSVELQHFQQIVWPSATESAHVWTGKAIEGLGAADGMLSHIKKRLEIARKRESAQHESSMRALESINKLLQSYAQKQERSVQQPPKMLTVTGEAP